MKDYCKKKDIQFTLHSMRHSHATELIEEGVPVKAIQKRLGHKSITTTLDIYASATSKMEKQIIDVLDKKEFRHNSPANMHGEKMAENL